MSPTTTVKCTASNNLAWEAGRRSRCLNQNSTTSSLTTCSLPDCNRTTFN